MPTFPITIITGPTAAGKSAYGLEYAAQHRGIILNADALQIYDALPILTAQPTAAEKNKIPHGLYGILPPDQTNDVQNWLTLCVAAIRQAWHDYQIPVVLGGTGFYLKALKQGLSPLPDIPDDIRADTRALHAKIGNPAFHARLKEIDPVMAAQLNPMDSQRLMRAYEVKRATGKSLKEWQALPPVPVLPEAEFTVIVVDGDRDVLRARAHARLQVMIKQGVLDEISAFAARIRSGSLPPTCPPTHALGYHAFSHVTEGSRSLEDALNAAHIETCQYIKRQQTWLRHQITADQTITTKI